MLFLWLFIARFMQTVAFYCSSDPAPTEIANEFALERNSMATKFRSIDTLFIFDKPCSCEHDWKNVFCSRLKAYRRMSLLESPTVCVCRQFDGLKAGCSQFLTRCFPGGFSGGKAERGSRCRCCFSQPDDYCYQLECQKMLPDFELSKNTSCLCYTQVNYPDWLCNPKKNNPASRSGYGKVRIYNSLSSINEERSWPYAGNVALVEDANFKRRISNSKEETVRDPQTSPKSGLIGIWLNGNVVMLPMLVATCIVLLALTGFGCFLVVLTKFQFKPTTEPHRTFADPNSNRQKCHYRPKTSAVVIQNRVEKNAIRLTCPSAVSSNNQLLKNPPIVRFSSLSGTNELCEVDYPKPQCNLKKQSVV